MSSPCASHLIPDSLWSWLDQLAVFGPETFQCQVQKSLGERKLPFGIWGCRELGLACSKATPGFPISYYYPMLLFHGRRWQWMQSSEARLPGGHASWYPMSLVHRSLPEDPHRRSSAGTWLAVDLYVQNRARVLELHPL